MKKQTPLTSMVQSFKDLRFRIQKSNVNCIEAKHTFENGITILVEGGKLGGVFGNGYDNFEVAVYNETKLFKLDNDAHFLTWASEKEINEIIKKILENKFN